MGVSGHSDPLPQTSGAAKDVGGQPDSPRGPMRRVGSALHLSASSEAFGGVMSRWTFPVVVATAIVALSPPSSAQSLISKKYILDRKQSDDVARMIANAAPSGLNINWPELRRKIYKSSLPTENFRSTSVAGRITISDDSPRPIIHVFAAGGSIKWRINDGQVLDVSAKLDGDTIEARFIGDGYEKMTIYRNIGQNLIAESTITSPMLSVPIRYKSIYN